MQIKRITVDGKQYDVTPFTPREAIALEVRIESLLGSVMPALNKLGGDGDIEAKTAFLGALPELASAAIEAVAKLDPELNLVFDVIRKTAYQGANGVSFALNTDDAVATVFTGNHLGLFTLAWEVLKANGFFITKATGLLDELTTTLKATSESTDGLTQASAANG